MERDELAHVIDRVIENESHLDLFAMPWTLADRIIAAGWRKVPDDWVVVRREDVDEDIWGASEVLARLRQALAEQKENDDN